MPRFLVIHDIVAMFKDQDDWIRDWSGMRKRAQGAALWLTSWYSAASNRMFCEWEAPTKDAIEGCFTPDELRMAPIVTVEEVVRVDPAWLDGAA